MESSTMAKQMTKIFATTKSNPNNAMLEYIAGLRSNNFPEAERKKVNEMKSRMARPSFLSETIGAV